MKHFNIIINKLKNWLKKLRNKNKKNTSTHFTKNELMHRVFCALEETGIMFSNEEIDEVISKELSEYLFDSLQIILFLVCLEQNLGYELSEELITSKNLKTITSLVDALYEANIM